MNKWLFTGFLCIVMIHAAEGMDTKKSGYINLQGVDLRDFVFYLETGSNSLKAKLCKRLKDNPDSLLNIDLPDNGSLTQKDQADLIFYTVMRLENNNPLRTKVLKKMVHDWNFPINGISKFSQMPLHYALEQYIDENGSWTALTDLFALGASPFAKDDHGESVFGLLEDGLKRNPKLSKDVFNRLKMAKKYLEEKYPQEVKKYYKQKK